MPTTICCSYSVIYYGGLFCLYGSSPVLWILLPNTEPELPDWKSTQRLEVLSPSLVIKIHLNRLRHMLNPDVAEGEANFRTAIEHQAAVVVSRRVALTDQNATFTHTESG